MKIFISVLMSVMMICSPILASDYLMLSELGTSAKSIGIGNIQGFDYSSNSIFENPASLGLSRKISLSAFTTNVVGQLNVTAFSASIVSQYGVFGFGYLQGAVDGIFETGSTGLEDNRFFVQSQFDYRDQTIKLAYSFSPYDSLYLGSNFVYYKKSFGKISGQGMGVEVGAYQQLAEGDISVTVRNLLSTPVAYSNSQQETLPLQFLISGFYPLWDFSIYSQWKYQSGKNGVFSLGGSSPVFGIPFLTLSAGYKQFWVLDAVSSGFTLGASLIFDQFEVNYAFEKGNLVEDSTMHYISFSIGLDGDAPQKLQILGGK